MKTKHASFTLIPILALFAVAASLAFAGCGKGALESDFPYAAPIVDNVLSGIGERDYGKFSKDFSEAMKGAIDEEGFPEVVDKMDGALGKYASRSFLRATKAKAKGKDLVIMKYRAAYEKDDQATLMVYISDYGGKKMVEGFAALPGGEK